MYFAVVTMLLYMHSTMACTTISTRATSSTSSSRSSTSSRPMIIGGCCTTPPPRSPSHVSVNHRIAHYPCVVHNPYKLCQTLSRTLSNETVRLSHNRHQLPKAKMMNPCPWTQHTEITPTPPTTTTTTTPPTTTTSSPMKTPTNNKKGKPKNKQPTTTMSSTRTSPRVTARVISAIKYLAKVFFNHIYQKGNIKSNYDYACMIAYCLLLWTVVETASSFIVQLNHLGTSPLLDKVLYIIICVGGFYLSSLLLTFLDGDTYSSILSSPRLLVTARTFLWLLPAAVLYLPIHTYFTYPSAKPKREPKIIAYTLGGRHGQTIDDIRPFYHTRGGTGEEEADGEEQVEGEHVATVEETEEEQVEQVQQVEQVEGQHVATVEETKKEQVAKIEAVQLRGKRQSYTDILKGGAGSEQVVCDEEREQTAGGVQEIHDIADRCDTLCTCDCTYHPEPTTSDARQPLCPAITMTVAENNISRVHTRMQPLAIDGLPLSVVDVSGLYAESINCIGIGRDEHTQMYLSEEGVDRLDGGAAGFDHFDCDC
eukprot:GHVQ01009349.1.p1 GENE.GHVQ01009349.1~~GHVQ01009349.1.p1  ORF type:complete len:538 (+),score=100.23 GHVQ01009349.1:637-2250(+)